MTTTWVETRDPLGAPTLEFTVERDGTSPVTGALWVPEDPDPDGRLILFGHGISYDRYHLPIPHMARRFAQECNWYSVAMDGPGHGLRMAVGADDETFLAEIRRPTVLDDMVVDWKVAIEAARGRIHHGGSRLGYFGLSMGTMFGLPLIAQRDDIDVAVLGLLGTTGAGSLFASDFLDAARAITCPVMYIMQLGDELFPRDGYLEVFDAIGSSDKRLHANPGGHVDVTTEEIKFAYDFIRFRTGGS